MIGTRCVRFHKHTVKAALFPLANWVVTGPATGVVHPQEIVATVQVEAVAHELIIERLALVPEEFLHGGGRGAGGVARGPPVGQSLSWSLYNIKKTCSCK